MSDPENFVYVDNTGSVDPVVPTGGGEERPYVTGTPQGVDIAIDKLDAFSPSNITPEIQDLIAKLAGIEAMGGRGNSGDQNLQDQLNAVILMSHLADGVKGLSPDAQMALAPSLAAMHADQRTGMSMPSTLSSFRGQQQGIEMSDTGAKSAANPPVTDVFKWLNRAYPGEFAMTPSGGIERLPAEGGSTSNKWSAFLDKLMTPQTLGGLGMAAFAIQQQMAQNKRAEQFANAQNASAAALRGEQRDFMNKPRGIYTSPFNLDLSKYGPQHAKLPGQFGS